MWRSSTTNRKAKEKNHSMLYKQIFIGLSLTMLFAVLMYATWYLTRIPALTIEVVEVIGGETISHDEILKMANSELEGAYYHLVPKRFSYVYPQETILEKVSAIPRVKHVSVEKNSRQKIVIIFEEYAPFGLWCEDAADQACVFVDGDGYAFSLAPQLQGAALVRYVDPTVVPEVGKTFSDVTFMRGAHAFTEALYDSLSLHVVVINKSEEQVVYSITPSGEIRTSLALSFEKTLQNLQTVLEAKEFAHLEAGNFAYIDLRYGNKVFVNEGNDDVATTTATSTAQE